MNMNKESDGERAVRTALEHLGIKFEQEKEISFLEDDSKGVRRADFFLPQYNTYMEYLGGWDTPNPQERVEERKRYEEKKQAYESNGIRCIWIYPNQLNFVSKRIKDELDKFGFATKPLKIYEEPLIIAAAVGLAAIVITIVLLPIAILPSAIIYAVVLYYLNLKKCPNCKRVFGKEHVRTEFVKIERRPWRYRIENRYLYSDGTHKNSTFSNERTRIERIKIFKHVKECKFCRFKWTESGEENLDYETRPQTVYEHRTKYRNPNRRRR